jgi:hypothetical protein
VKHRRPDYVRCELCGYMPAAPGAEWAERQVRMFEHMADDHPRTLSPEDALRPLSHAEEES